MGLKRGKFYQIHTKLCLMALDLCQNFVLLFILSIYLPRHSVHLYKINLSWRGIMHACSAFMLIVILLFHDYRQSSVNVNSILCSGNETSLSQCNYTLGTCQYHQEQASLLCRQAGLTPGTSTITLHM